MALAFQTNYAQIRALKSYLQPIKWQNEGVSVFNELWVVQSVFRVISDGNCWLHIPRSDESAFGAQIKPHDAWVRTANNQIHPLAGLLPRGPGAVPDAWFGEHWSLAQHVPSSEHVLIWHLNSVRLDNSVALGKVTYRLHIIPPVVSVIGHYKPFFKFSLFRHHKWAWVRSLEVTV